MTYGTTSRYFPTGSLDGKGDGSWRENFDIPPTAAVELDFLAEAVEELDTAKR